MNHRRTLRYIAFIVVGVGGMTTAMALDRQPDRATAPPETEAKPVDPHLVVGTDRCVKCHASEVQVWRNTPHAQTFEALHRRPEARQIADRLNIQSIKYDGRCVACHYTQQADPTDGHISAIAGISCESCHGGAADWLDIHHDYGGPLASKQTETREHREQRLRQSIAAGMRNPNNLYLIAQNCYRCHTVGDEQLVNVGGHNAGSLDFEFVSWSQGTIHHNFLETDGQVNQPSSRERLRKMFVVGLVADLESSLRAVSSATEKATYGVTVAKRADRAAKRLRSAQQRLQHPRLEAILEIYDSQQLRLSQSESLRAAADAVARQGFLLASEPDADAFEAIDPFIPPTDRWK